MLSVKEDFPCPLVNGYYRFCLFQNHVSCVFLRHVIQLAEQIGDTAPEQIRDAIATSEVVPNGEGMPSRKRQ